MFYFLVFEGERVGAHSTLENAWRAALYRARPGMEVWHGDEFIGRVVEVKQ
jgi:hypothetical protein